MRVAVQRRFIDQFPHWWLFSLSFSAWAALAVGGLATTGSIDVTTLGAICGRSARNADVLSVWLASIPMMFAMVLPLTIGGARRVAERSLWGRRQRGIAVYVASYVATWAVVAFFAIALSTSVVSELGALETSTLCGALFLAAAAFRSHSLHRTARATCHDVQPLAPMGWTADLSCLRYGVHHGKACVISCGLATAAAYLSRYPMAYMAIASTVSYAERYRLRADSRLPSALLLVAAAGSLVI